MLILPVVSQLCVDLPPRRGCSLLLHSAVYFPLGPTRPLVNHMVLQNQTPGSVIVQVFTPLDGITHLSLAAALKILPTSLWTKLDANLPVDGGTG